MAPRFADFFGEKLQNRCLQGGSAPWLCTAHDFFGKKLKDRCLQGSSTGKFYQTLVLMFVGQAALRAALKALVALAPLLSRTLGSISLALSLGLSNTRRALEINATIIWLPLGSNLQLGQVPAWVESQV